MLKYEENDKQNAVEFARFLDLIKEHGVSSYLEIGSKHGGSLWGVAQVLPKGARIVSVDLPYRPANADNLCACVTALRKRGFDVQLILNDSTNADVVKAVRKRGPFDLVLIDANHWEPWVRKDWANYGPLGRLIAFHDIAWKFLPHKENTRVPIHVPIVWKELKQQFEHVEISCEPADNGIGVLFREKPIGAS